MIARYTYLGDETVEVVVDGDVRSVQINHLAQEAPAPALPQATPPGSSTESGLQPVDAEEDLVSPSLALCEPAPAPTRKQRASAATVRGIKTFVISLLGMTAAGLTYVQQAWGNLDEISLKVIIPVVGGAVLAGLLYFLDKYLRPDSRF